MLRTSSGSGVAQNACDLAIIERRLLQATTIGYDAETEGLDPYKDSIVGHVLSFGPDPGDTYYVPVRHGGGGNIDQVDQFEDLLAAKGQTQAHWFGHNIQFDLRFLDAHGINIRGTLEDTQVNAAIIDELGSFGLAACCIAMNTTPKLGEDLYRHLASLFGGPPDSSSMQHFHKLSGTDSFGTDYATGDGVSTWSLRTRQIERIQMESLDYIYDLERRITRVVYRMQLRGIKADREELARVREFAEGKVKGALIQFPKGFSERSNKDVREWMESKGYRDAPHSPKGKNLAKEGNLEEADKHRSYNEQYLKQYPEGQAVLDIRKYSNLIASFVDPLMRRHIRVDGRVHCTYYQMAADDFGTRTGRFSCTDPNLQQVPKRNMELGYPFRRVFVPDVGCEWLTADLSQCEPRILAHYSGARTLLEGYLAEKPVDAHSAVTIAARIAETQGLPFKEAREIGKRINQTLITGGGKGKIVGMLGANGEQIYDDYFKASPEIKVLLKQAGIRFRSRGYVTSYLGRRARLEDPEKSFVAANRLLQCGNADIIKQSLADMDDFYEQETGDQVYLMNTVHDSVDINVPEGMREQAVRGLRYMAQYGPHRRFYLRVPMACEYGFGPNWGEATYKADQVVLGQDWRDASFHDPNPVKPTPPGANGG
jgi:DNA polymerase-1